MSDGESEESEEVSEESEDDSSSESTVDRGIKKAADVEKDIELLRHIGAYIDRTALRISKRLVKEESERRQVVVETKDSSVQTTSSSSSVSSNTNIQDLPAIPPLTLRSNMDPGLSNVRTRQLNTALSHYELMSDSERSRLVNDAIAVLLNDSHAEMNS
jgi:hypothetical protein